MFPITIIFDGLSKLFDKIFKAKKDDTFTEEDFENVVEKVSDEGLLEEEQSEIIQSALDFVDTNVKEVLTPREKMFTVNIRDVNREQLENILINTNYSRIPVYDREFDNIIGILNVKIYFREISKNPNVLLRKIIQKPYFVSSSIMIDDLFNGFKKNHSHIAIVRNSKKQVIGMVTMEDVLEELVSDISEQPTVLEGGSK
jgi:CBS domain containing-hemolysin-like protein